MKLASRPCSQTKVATTSASRRVPRDLVESGAYPGRAERAELRAATLYASGYWCAESVVKTVNEIAGQPLPAQVMRMASGFCEGLGGSRCTCGALAGAVMAAGLLGGREGPDDAWEPSYDAAGELRRRFVADQDASACDEIVARIGDMDSPERWAHCAELVGRSARWVVEIAETEGWLPAE
jgi:C_GCAxxG_C_C family probable redox protein